MVTDPLATLRHIADRLAQGANPADLISELLPKTTHDVLTWARHLSLWEAYPQAGQRAIAVARIVSRRVMRQDGLIFDDEGRVVDGLALAKAMTAVKRANRHFKLPIGGAPVSVDYTEGYCPKARQNLFSFIGEPRQRAQGETPGPMNQYKPHALSETGWLSHYAAHDAVQALGGPEAYARQFAQEVLEARDHEFEAVFIGPKEGSLPRKKRPFKMMRDNEEATATESRPVIDEHTAALEEEPQQQPDSPLRQGQLF
jgi:hypothetical protein